MCDKRKENSLKLTNFMYGNYIHIKLSEAFIHDHCQSQAGLKRIVLSG